MNFPWVQWVHIGSRLLQVWYYDLGLIFIFLPPLLLFAWSMTRGQEETSTSQAGRRRGPSRESLSASSIISSLSMDEVRYYCQIPEDIEFELSEDIETQNHVRHFLIHPWTNSYSTLHFSKRVHNWKQQ